MKAKEIYIKETGDECPYIGNFSLEALYNIALINWKDRYIAWLAKQVEETAELRSDVTFGVKIRNNTHIWKCICGGNNNRPPIVDQGGWLNCNGHSIKCSYPVFKILNQEE